MIYEKPPAHKNFIRRYSCDNTQEATTQTTTKGQAFGKDRASKYLEEYADVFADRMENRGIAKGINRGIAALVSSLKKYHVSDENIVEEIIKQFSLSKDAAQKFL